MRRIRVLIMPLIVFAAVVTGCEKPGAARAADDGIFPYRQGSHWQYYAATSTPETPAVENVMHTWVAGYENVGDKQYAKVFFEPERLYNRTKQEFLFRDAPEGVYRIDAQHRAFGEYLETPRPLNVGTKWTVKGPLFTLAYEVEGIADVDVIHDQRYEKCWKIKFEGTSNQEPIIRVHGTVYRCPTIGEVKSTMHVLQDAETQTLEQQLARYQAPGTKGLALRD